MATEQQEAKFVADFVAELRGRFEAGATVGHLSNDYEMEPELVRNILGDTKRRSGMGAVSKGRMEEALCQAFRESGTAGQVVTPYLLQALAKIAVETCDQLGCVPPRK